MSVRIFTCAHAGLTHAAVTRKSRGTGVAVRITLRIRLAVSCSISITIFAAVREAVQVLEVSLTNRHDSPRYYRLVQALTKLPVSLSTTLLSTYARPTSQAQRISSLKILEKLLRRSTPRTITNNTRCPSPRCTAPRDRVGSRSTWSSSSWSAGTPSNCNCYARKTRCWSWCCPPRSQNKIQVCSQSRSRTGSL